MTQRPRLVVTHGDPDLDAVGFVYSAQKVFGPTVPVECRWPTRQELEEPSVIVGDIGLLGCEAIGHSSELNNFDHHYSHAARSATFLFNEVYRSVRQDLADYIDQVDTRPQPEAAESTLKVVMAGIRVWYRGSENKDHAVLRAGETLLAWIEETGQQPGDLQGPFPPEIRTYLDKGRDELRKIREDLRGAGEDRTTAGRRLAFVVTRSSVLSLVKEEMFATGAEIAVVHETGNRRFSIACNLAKVKEINLKAGDLIPSLDELEHKKGLPKGKGWGGHEDRLGSPKPTGSLLAAEEVLAVVRAVL